MPALILGQDFTLREFRETDIPTAVEIGNLIFPDEPTTLEQERYWESIYPPGNPRRRLVAELADGRAVAMGTCMKPFWLKADGVYSFFAAVHPDWRHRGIGQALYAAVTPLAAEQGATRLWTNCRESFTDTIRFLQAAGFQNIGIRFESELEMPAFDESPFVAAFDQVAQHGYVLTTLAAERARVGDAAADRRLYDLYDATIADVPLPGGARIALPYDQWRRGTLENPDADPEAMFIARLGEEYAGTTIFELLHDGPAITNYTGVLQTHRRRGLAMALKLMSFRFLRARGYRTTRTHNDTANPSILRLNERLGYRRLPGALAWERMLS